MTVTRRRTCSRRLAVLFAAVIAAGSCGGDTVEDAASPEPQQKGPVAKPRTERASERAETEKQPLVVWVEGGPFTGKAPLTVEFEADMSGGHEPLSPTWTFGDGQTSTEANPTHVYTKAGTYEARLDVKDARPGDPDEDWDSVEVEVTE
jgi:hypothetical protein